MKKKKKQSTVVFLGPDVLPEREQIEAVLADLGANLQWREEHEIAHTRALSLKLNDAEIALSVIGAPMEPELYTELLEMSGLSQEDKAAILGHGSHARVVYMDEETPVEPVNRMTAVYQVATRLGRMDGVAVLAPASGVFVLGLTPEHLDEAIEREIPPLDLWVAVEMKDDDHASTTGATHIGLPELELSGVGILDPDSIYSTVLDILLYLRRIRRELVPGETLHVGQQPWSWITMRGSDDLVKLRRIDADQETNVKA